jgi:ureidoacrylate peracid hydrolase
MLLPIEELVDPAKTAIIVVDVQNDFCHPDGAAGKNGKPTDAAMAIIPALQHLLDEARAHGTHVIWIQTIHDKATDSDAWIGRHDTLPIKNCLRDTWGADFCVVGPLGDEPVVEKHRYSAFINTRLDSILRTLKVENILVCGVATNVCVESTSRHGFMLDYNATLISDCCASRNQAAHDMALRNHAKCFGVVATSNDIIGAWNAALTPA